MPSRPPAFEDPELVVRRGRTVAAGPARRARRRRSGGCRWTRAARLAGQNVIDLVAERRDPGHRLCGRGRRGSTGAFAAQISVSHDGLSWTADGAAARRHLPADDRERAVSPAAAVSGGRERATSRPDSSTSPTTAASLDPQPQPRRRRRRLRERRRSRRSGSRVPALGFLRAARSSSATTPRAPGRWWRLGPGPLTGFALSPDGGQVAIGGSDGVQILSRLPGDAGGGYAVVRRAAVPVGCLTWTAAGLYACGDDRTAGFTIGLSTDGAATFRPMLRLAQLAPRGLSRRQRGRTVRSGVVRDGRLDRRRVCRGRGRRCRRRRVGRRRRGFGLRVRGGRGARRRRGRARGAVARRAGAGAGGRRLHEPGDADRLPAIRRGAVANLVDDVFAPARHLSRRRPRAGVNGADGDRLECSSGRSPAPA